MTETLNLWITNVIEALGGPGVAILIALESIFPPIPSEAVLLSAGFAAGQGSLNVVAAVIWTTIGSVVGAVALYYVGYLLGRERVRHIVKHMPLMKVSDVDKTEDWFIKHDTKAVFFGRMVPLFRSFISIPAGLAKMNMYRFVIYTAAGSLVWNTLFIYLGYVLGDNWHVAERYAEYFQYGVILAIIVAVLWWAVRRKQRSR